MAELSRVALSAEQLATLQSLPAEHDVRLVVLFGSATRPEREQNDIDLAVEFDDWRPGDEGYTTAYLGLATALEEELDVTVDLMTFTRPTTGLQLLSSRMASSFRAAKNAKNSSKTRSETPTRRSKMHANELLLP
mgnify:CR=1 FL=1|jgi:predicted nucleotidyltransferase